MSQSTHVHQIIAKHHDGTTIKQLLSFNPIHFGSGSPADLCLESETISAVSGRLLLSQSGKVIVMNLAEPFMTLDGSTIPFYTPVEWKPGSHICIGEYRLEIMQVDEQTASLRQPIHVEYEENVSHEHDVVMPVAQASTDSELENWMSTSSIQINDQPLNVPMDLPEDAPTQRPVTIPEISQWIGIEAEDKTPDYATGEGKTEAYFVPLADRLGVLPPVTAEDTLFKDWREEGRLSAQLGIESVNFVPGERIRIPLSVSSDYSHVVELAAEITGLPSDWFITDTAILKLAPGQLQAFDLIVQTRPTTAAQVEATIRLYDQYSPEIAIQIPFKMILKSQRDLVGWIDPPTATDSSLIYLVLQNHTRSTMRVAITGHSASPDMRVILPQSQVELTPSQTIRVLLKVEIMKASWFQIKTYPFWVSAQQGTRAPLDFPGTIRIRPRLWLWMLLVFAILLPALAIFTSSNVANASPPVPTSVVQATATVLSLSPTALNSVMATITPHPTSTPMPSATPTPPFSDPRSSNCAAAIRAPHGWQPYTIVVGDNIFRLGIRYGTTVDEIARVNCLADTGIITVGDVILLPSS